MAELGVFIAATGARTILELAFYVLLGLFVDRWDKIITVGHELSQWLAAESCKACKDNKENIVLKTSGSE